MRSCTRPGFRRPDAGGRLRTDPVPVRIRTGRGSAIGHRNGRGIAPASRRPGRLQGGQALIEMAFVLPVGLLLLLAVGYLGRALLERQTLVGAARYAAREAALAATRSPLDKATGLGLATQAGSAGNRARDIQQAAKGRPAQSAPPRWESATGVHFSQLEQRLIGPYAIAYVAKKRESVGTGKSLQFGIGFVLYGARATERLAFLEPVRKATYAASRANPAPAKGLAAPLEISASAYMPGELPLHGPVGVLELNPWIKDILEETE